MAHKQLLLPETYRVALVWVASITSQISSCFPAIFRMAISVEYSFPVATCKAFHTSHHSRSRVHSLNAVWLCSAQLRIGFKSRLCCIASRPKLLTSHNLNGRKGQQKPTIEPNAVEHPHYRSVCSVLLWVCGGAQSKQFCLTDIQKSNHGWEK